MEMGNSDGLGNFTLDVFPEFKFGVTDQYRKWYDGMIVDTSKHSSPEYSILLRILVYRAHLAPGCPSSLLDGLYHRTTNSTTRIFENRKHLYPQTLRKALRNNAKTFFTYHFI